MNDFLDNLANDQYRKMHNSMETMSDREKVKKLEREIDIMCGSEYESGIDYS